MKILPSIIIFLLPIVVAPCLQAQDKKPAAVRIALVSSDKSESAHNIMALAEVRLSSAPGLVLVDRQSIDKVLAEQKLSLAGEISADQALNLGKLLSVDLFGVVEVGLEAKGVAGLVVFDARTGVRLVDTALPSNTIGASVDAVVTAVQGAQRKNQDVAQLRPICLMAVRNANLPRHLDSFCDSVGLLLERQLSSSPDLAVLERRRLEQVNKERDLPITSPLRTLLTSVLVVELDVATTPDSKGLTATAFLSDSRGNSLSKVIVTVPNRNAADLAQALAQEMAKKLDKKPGPLPAPARRSLEASRFLCDQQYFVAHQDFARAIRATESAYALCPEDVRIRAILAQVHCQYAERLVNCAIPSPFGTGIDRFKVDTRAVDLSFVLMRRVNALWIEIETLSPEANVSRPHIDHFWYQLLNLRQQTFSDDQVAVIKELLAQQKQAFEIRVRRARQAVVDTPSFDRYTNDLYGYVTSRCGNKYLKDTDWLEEIEQLNDWAALARKQGDDLPQIGIHFLQALVQSCDLPNQTPRHRQLPPGTVDRLLRMWADIAKHPNRIVALYGRIGEVTFAVAFAKLSDQEARARLHAIRLSIEADLKADPALSPNLRYLLYRAGTELFTRHFMPGAIDELTDFCQFMLARKDLYFALVTADAQRLFNNRPLPEEKQRSIFDVLQRSLDLLESNQVRLIVDKDTHSLQAEQTVFRNKCLELQAQIRKEAPTAVPPLEPRWESAFAVLDVLPHNTGILWLLKPIIYDGSIYVTAVRREGSPTRYALQLLRLTPGQPRAWQGKPIEIPEPDLDGRSSLGPERSRLFQFAPSVCIHDGCYYLGTKANGIYAMPFDGSQPVHISMAEGLPSDNVQCLAGFGTRLYACLGDSHASYIVNWDLKASRCDVLASSRRKDKKSLFDNAPPITQCLMIPDPARRRLIFLPTSGAGVQVWSGIWALEPEDGSFKQLLSLPGASSWLLNESATIEGNQLITTSAVGIFSYDLEKKEPILLYAGKAALRADKLPDLTYQLEALSEYRVLRSDFGNVRGPHLVVDDWVWGSSPFSCCRIQDGKAEMLPPLRSGARYFMPTTIIPFGKERQLLIADPFTIWLVTLPKK